MKTSIDLHYLTYEQARKNLEVFIDDLVAFSGSNKNLFNVEIITGNSENMKQITKDVLAEYELDYTEGDMYNKGYIKTII